MDTRLPQEVFVNLVCPSCSRSPLAVAGDELTCTSTDCRAVFPVIDGLPILINERNSIFDIADFTTRSVTTMDLSDKSNEPMSVVQKLKQWVNRKTPSISFSANDFPVESALVEIKRANPDRQPLVLILGAGDAQLNVGGECKAVYSDVAAGPLTQLICDAHDVPFPDGYFDAVVAMAMLEHVVDPIRCVSEIHRVLRPEGFVYAATPFMQQVHMGRYDFTRFTHLGHRRLFRWFTEERSGVANGPAMVLAWSFDRFLSGFASTGTTRSLLRSLAHFLAFPLRYFDRRLARLPGAYDSASAYYFFGRRSDTPFPDRDIVKSYRGMIHQRKLEG